MMTCVLNGQGLTVDVLHLDQHHKDFCANNETLNHWLDEFDYANARMSTYDATSSQWRSWRCEGNYWLNQVIGYFCPLSIL